MSDKPAPVASADAADWRERRLSVARRWTEVARHYGKPATAYEVTAAVMADAAIRDGGLHESPLYDRRALLNVIAVLLDEAAIRDTAALDETEP